MQVVFSCPTGQPTNKVTSDQMCVKAGQKNEKVLKVQDVIIVISYGLLFWDTSMISAGWTARGYRLCLGRALGPELSPHSRPDFHIAEAWKNTVSDEMS